MTSAMYMGKPGNITTSKTDTQLWPFLGLSIHGQDILKEFF